LSRQSFVGWRHALRSLGVHSTICELLDDIDELVIIEVVVVVVELIVDADEVLAEPPLPGTN